jgi:putative endonuclease
MPSFSGDRENSEVQRPRGQVFEKLAARFYEQHGFEVIERNWRTDHKEIDLIVKKNDLVAFVEVKSATTAKFGHPAERVDDKKIANLTQAAQRYLVSHDISGCDLRFDVVAFVNGTLEHFPNAFPAAE